MTKYIYIQGQLAEYNALEVYKRLFPNHRIAEESSENTISESEAEEHIKFMIWHNPELHNEMFPNRIELSPTPVHNWKDGQVVEEKVNFWFKQEYRVFFRSEDMFGIEESGGYVKVAVPILTQDQLDAPKDKIEGMNKEPK